MLKLYQVCCLLVLAVAVQAQFYNNFGYGLGGYNGYGYGGYYPVAPVAYSGVPAPVVHAAVPATTVPAYGYPSFTSTQFHAQDELGQARFGYAHPGQASTNYRDAMGKQDRQLRLLQSRR